MLSSGVVYLRNILDRHLGGKKHLQGLDLFLMLLPDKETRFCALIIVIYLNGVDNRYVFR